MSLGSPATSHFGVSKHFEMAGVRLAIVQTEESGTQIGWHDHENPHLTFVLRGHVLEGTKKEILHCAPGDLLFQSAFEPHYNKTIEASATCLHIDFAQNDLDDFPAQQNKLRGIVRMTNPAIKFSCYKLIRETIIADDVSAFSTQTLTLQILGQMLFPGETANTPRPDWVRRAEDILRCDCSEKLSLDDLSHELNIHPVHLSRSFSKYFDCTLGEYVRNLRVERSLALMSRRNVSLTEIASNCGFADQSHFIRSFKAIMGVTPSAYRKLFSS